MYTKPADDGGDPAYALEFKSKPASVVIYNMEPPEIDAIGGFLTVTVRDASAVSHCSRKLHTVTIILL